MKLLLKVVPWLLVILLFGVPALWAQPQSVPPPPPNQAPSWSPVPQVPGVYYAPNLTQDLFRYGNQFYYFSQGLWQIAQALNGPWQVIENPPPVFHEIREPYFKSAPGMGQGQENRLARPATAAGTDEKIGPGWYFAAGTDRKETASEAVLCPREVQKSGPALTTGPGRGNRCGIFSSFWQSWHW